MFPNSPVDRAASNGWHWHHAAQRAFTDGEDTMQAAPYRTTGEILDAIQSCNGALVEALPTLGKSYGSVTAAAETGEPVAITTRAQGAVRPTLQLVRPPLPDLPRPPRVRPRL